MNNLVRKIGITLLSIGFDPRKFFSALLNLVPFLVQYAKFSLLYKNTEWHFRRELLPILSDRYMESGSARGHYFFQDLWAARKIKLASPKDHIDIGSRIDGFVAHLLCFRHVKVIDIRPLTSNIDGLTFIKSDILSLDPSNHKSDSVSCLHALEHFGLGRYGDKIDIDAWAKAIKSLSELVQYEGRLYIGVPVGTHNKIVFNAHRVFRPETIIYEANKYNLQLTSFSYIDDNGVFREDFDPSTVKGNYGCGCFEFKKTMSLNQ